jgi:hypothetical protein
MEYKYVKNLRKMSDDKVRGNLMVGLYPGSKLTNMDTKRVVFMTPMKYLSLGMPYEYRIDWDDEQFDQVNNVRDKIKRGIPIDPLLLFIDIDTNRVTGEDGVHRALAAKELGIKKVPVYIIYTKRVADKKLRHFDHPDICESRHRPGICTDSLYGVNTIGVKLSNKILPDPNSDTNEYFGHVPLSDEFKQRYKYRKKKIVKSKPKRKCRCK